MASKIKKCEGNNNLNISILTEDNIAKTIYQLINQLKHANKTVDITINVCTIIGNKNNQQINK